MTMTTRTSTWLLTASLALGVPVAARAQQPASELTLEDLMDARVERVFGASKRLQPVTDAPSSVTIVTADEIARMGYQSIAELLRGVRGFYVSYDRNYSYLGARGFAFPGDYNTRVLLLIDGHRLNDNVYDQAAIGPELGIDLLSVDRVEIIRGPSSSLYGTNAVFGVINIITRPGSAVNGVKAEVQTGTFGSHRASVIGGGTRPNGVDFAVAGSFERSDGPASLYIPAFDSPDTNDGIVRGLDDEQMSQVRGHVKRGGLAVRGAYTYRDKGVPTGSYGTRFNDPRLRTSDARAFADVEYQRTVKNARVDMRTYIDRYHYEGGYPYAAPGEPDSLLSDYATGAWWGVDGRVSRGLAGRQTLTLGSEFRRNFKQDQGAHYGDLLKPTLFIRESSHTTGVYVQDEIAISAQFIVNGGLRYDHYEGFSRLTPRAALIFKPTPNRAIKYLFGRAFRAPNAYELDYYADLQGPLNAESLDSHEVIWEEYGGSWLRTSVSGYFNHVDDLIRLDGMASPDELFFVNQGHVDAAGAEVEAEIKSRSGIHAVASYSLQHAQNQETKLRLTNSPRHLVKGRLILPMVRAGSSLAVEIERMSARTTLAGAQVDPATLIGLNLVEPLGRAVAVTARIRNILNRRYLDPGSEEHVQDAIEQNGRTFTVGLRWSLD